MKFIITILLALVLAGCSYEYMGVHNEKAFIADRHSIKVKLFTNYIKEKDEAFRNDTNGEVLYIQAIEIRRKDSVGVYGYNVYADHYGHVKFFKYDGKEVTLLNRNKLDSLQLSIRQFLKENHFSKHCQYQAKKKVEAVWKIFATDVF